MVKSWAFEFFFASPELEANFNAKDSIAYFDFYLDLWSRAEEWGFDGVFLSEHHFGGGYSPSPNLLLPVIAERTKTLRLGVMGMVVPYHNPWRLAEEIGMLDNLTQGRLEVGTSAGIPAEFQTIGMETQEARARYDEGMEIIDAAMRDNVVTHKGKYWNLENLPIRPRPVQQPAPPRWTTVISVESARKAARRGSKISTGFHPNGKVKEIFDAYNEEAEKAGNPSGPDCCALRRQIVINSDEAMARERLAQHQQIFMQMMSGDKRMASPSKKALDAPGTHAFTIAEEEFICGTPDQVAEEVNAQCDATGAGHFLVTFAGHHSLDELAQAWELYGTKVIPQTR